MSRFYVRVVHTEDGWQVRRGAHRLGLHDHIEDALAQARAEAILCQPSEVMVHHANGAVVSDSLYGVHVEPEPFCRDHHGRTPRRVGGGDPREDDARQTRPGAS